MDMHYALDNHIHSFSSVTRYVFLVGRHISFSLVMPINFEIVHMNIYQTTNAY